MSKRDLVVPFIVLAVVAALGIAALLAAIFGDRWGLAAKKARLLAFLTAMSAALAGCVGGGDTRDAIDRDAATGQDAGTDPDTDSDSDGDSDTGADSDSDADADAGSCSGVTCYESVPPVSEDVFLLGDGATAAVSIEADGGRALHGSYRTTYAARVSYRILDLRDRVIAAADVVPLALSARGNEARFSVTLPEDLPGGAYVVELFATTLKNVITYDTFPVSRYRLEVPSDAGGR